MITDNTGDKTMIPAIYLLDFENVNSQDFLDLSTIAAEDEIHIFYTDHCPKISLDLLNGLQARLCVHHISSGNQEVDMHIAGKLGYLICRYGNTRNYFIISNDKGYANLAETFVKEEDVTVTLQAYIGKIREKKEEPVIVTIPQKTQASIKTELNNRILSVFAQKYDSVTAGKVASTVVRNYGKKNSKQLIYRSLLKEMKKETGSLIYNDLKDQNLI